MSRVDEMVELIRGRIHSEFDGECHLTDTEAHAVADLLSELDADYLRRHKDATDRFCEVQELRQLLSEAEKREKDARAKALEEAAKVAEGKARDFNFQQALADYDDLAVGENGVRIEIADNIRALQSEER